MSQPARERLVELLGEQEESPASSAYRKLFMSDLSVTVDGIGRLRFPVPEEEAAQLRGIGHRARFGRGEETLTDVKVRDTWEIPRDLVHIEWTEAFGAVLELMRDELGLPAHCELTPEFHSMLVYETGQFFVPHQDSEKDDSMIGTLVVTLPSAHTGGELLVEHLGETAEYRGSGVAVSLVAFYADCRHEVLPVTEGHRITLTYNLLLTGDGGAVPDRTAAGDLAACLTDYFATPVAPRYGGMAVRPMRLAYLLDHEYTARGLGWSQLKGADAERAALLREAAGLAGCDAVLALAEIQEIWDADDSGGADHWYEEEEDDDGPGEGQYTARDLIDSSITLDHWVGLGEGEPAEVSLTIRDEEIVTATPSSALTPYASHYEGYMGNYGNTLDRWYRRAALVVWPRETGFANRAQVSPLGAMDELRAMASAGNAAGARDAARSLAPFWDRTVHSVPRDELFTRTLATVGGLDDAETATDLLRPFHLELLLPEHAANLAAAAARYGDAWTSDLLRGWFEGRRAGAYAQSPERLEWLPALPALCAALSSCAGTATAHLILDLSWAWFADTVRAALTGPSTPSGDTWLAGLGRPLAGILAAAARTGPATVLDAAADLPRGTGDQVIVLVMAALRELGPRPAGGEPPRALAELAAGCAERIRASLAGPRRADGDWSVEPPAGCACELCATLGGFLRDPGRRTFEWPLAQAKRAHVHSRIERAELPVRHRTRRQGRPYTLVLAKTDELFARERLTRSRGEDGLAWLTANWTAGT